MTRILGLLLLGAAGVLIGFATRPHYPVTSSAVSNTWSAPRNVQAPTRRAQAAFVSNADLVSAIDAAQRSIVASAYTLSPESPLLTELSAAAARGVHVQIVLTGSGLGYAVRDNRMLKAHYPAFNILLLNRPIHLKAVVIDGGRAVFLSDRNFARSHDLVLALAATDALPVERAAIGDPHDAPPFYATKGSALAAEAALIDNATQTISFESESFGPGNPVADALERAILGRHVRAHIIVAAREEAEPYHNAERRLLARLQRAGAIITLSSADQKICIVDGRSGFFGSTNATRGYDSQIDFGYETDRYDLLETMQTAINEDTTGAD